MNNIIISGIMTSMTMAHMVYNKLFNKQNKWINSKIIINMINITIMKQKFLYTMMMNLEDGRNKNKKKSSKINLNT
jgi:hypothetical protein